VSILDRFLQPIDESAGDAQSCWDGNYTPLPDTRDVSRTMPAAAHDRPRESSR
jgi:hypothetical protein